MGLVESSHKTQNWLKNIQLKIFEKISKAEYKEGKYWASFKSCEKGRNFTQLHPTKNQIRIFTKLPLEFDIELQPTPSTQNWAKTFPTIFTLRKESDILKAIYLIYQSYKHDLTI